MLKDYEKKELLYLKSSKLLRRRFTVKTIKEWVADNNRHKLLTVVRRKVLNAEKILENVAKGQFTGKY
jgi:hypothetical protein